MSADPIGPTDQDPAASTLAERVAAAAELVSGVSRDLMGPDGPRDAVELRAAVEGLTRLLVAAGDTGASAGAWVRRADVVGRASGYERVDRPTREAVRRLGYWTRSVRAIAEDVHLDLTEDTQGRDELHDLLDRHGYVTDAADEAGL